MDAATSHQSPQEDPRGRAKPTSSDEPGGAGSHEEPGFAPNAENQHTEKGAGQAEPLPDDLGASLSKLLDQAIDTGHVLVRETGRVIEDTVVAVVDGTERLAGKAKEKIVEKTAQALHKLAADPNVPPTQLQQLSKLAPVYGELKQWADAHAMYYRAKETGDQNMLDMAYREGMCACIGAGVNAVTFGVGGHLARGISFLGRLLPSSFVGAVGARAAQFIITNASASKFSVSERSRKILDALFESVPPMKTEPQADSKSEESGSAKK